jgi:hypothetical protein
MARRRLFDDEGKTIKMEHVEVKETTTGRGRFFDEAGISEFQKAQMKVEEERKSVDPFAGQEIRQATGKEEIYKEKKSLLEKAADLWDSMFGKKDAPELYERIIETGKQQELYYGRSGHATSGEKLVGAGESLGGGILGVAEGTGRGFEWLGVDSLKPINDKIEYWRKTIEVQNPTYGEKIVSGVGSMTMFYVPGVGAQAGAAMIAKVSPRMAAWFGGSVMTGLEAMTESGMVWKELKDSGKSEEEADKAAENVFWANSCYVWF